MPELAADEFLRAAAAVGAEASLIGTERKRALLERIEAAYGAVSPSLWSGLPGTRVVTRSGWRVIDDLAPGRPAIVFFPSSDWRHVADLVEVRSGSLTAILGECGPTEYYVTDADVRFLIADSHEDIFTAAGGLNHEGHEGHEVQA